MPSCLDKTADDSDGSDVVERDHRVERWLSLDKRLDGACTSLHVRDANFDHSRIEGQPPKRKAGAEACKAAPRFGMVFQNYALFPHLTVFENIAFGLRLRHLGKGEIAQRVQNAIMLVHLDGYENKYPAQMSGGEQQRVAIARCIVLEPRLLLLDEPLSNLDAKLRIELRYELKALHERLKITTIYVTHDQTEALALSDRIVVLRSGEIQQVGTPAQIFSDPANLFVADFMGFKNIWSVRIESLKEAADSLDARLASGSIVLNARLPYAESDPRRTAMIQAFNSGAQVCTVIRPEDLHIGAASGMNRLQVLADLVEYQGQSSQISAIAYSDASHSGEGLRVDLKSDLAVREGESFEIGIPVDKILVFAAPKTAVTPSGGAP